METRTSEEEFKKLLLEILFSSHAVKPVKSRFKLSKARISRIIGIIISIYFMINWYLGRPFSIFFQLTSFFQSAVIVAFAPIHAFFLMPIWPGTSDCLFCGDKGCPSDSRLTFGAISTLSSMVIPPRPRKVQSKLINTFLPILCLK